MRLGGDPPATSPTRNGDYPGGKAGDVLTVDFTVLGQHFVGLNGPEFTFDEAVSFQVFTYHGRVLRTRGKCSSYRAPLLVAA